MALVGGLIGGAGGNIGSASVALLLNTSQFDAGLAASQGKLTGAAAKMESVGRKMSAVGGALTRGLSVPLALAGGVATKMALDFNEAFVRIQTLGGKTGQSMEQMKASVLDLAEATGQDPGGLANALYTVSSAGKEAASQAIPILTQAAKGAAIGMGDVETITKVLTATTNAYGSENLSAAQAMDILTQATHDSSAEADEMAAALGPVIGIASQVGISFDQVAAALASATIQGVSTDRAATGLRFLMQSLAAPTQIASQKLQQYGFSAQDLQRLIAKEGLQGSLQTLADTFDLTSTRGQQAWKAVVGGARGAIIANTLVGQHAEDAAAEVENLGDVADVTNKKFELWGETITGKNAKALGELKAAAIRIGQELIPIFEKVVDVVGGMVKAFNNLPQGVQAGIVAFGLWAAALGPILKLAGNATLAIRGLGSAFGLLGKAGAGAAGAKAAGAGATQLALPFEAAAAGASTLASTLVALGIPLAAAIGWFALFKHGIAEHNAAVDENIQKIHQQTGAIEDLQRVSQERARGNMMTADAKAATEALSRYRHEMEMVVRAQDFANTSTEHWTKSLLKGSKFTKSEAQSVASLSARFDSLGGHLSATQRAYIEASAKVGDYDGAVKILQGSINRLVKQKYNVDLKADTSQAKSAIDSFISTQNGRTITLQTRVQPVAGTTVRAQHGFEGTVSRPTLFLAGEAGMSEHVSVRPSGHGRASADRHRPTFVLNFNAPVMGSDVGQIVEKALTDRILKRGALV